MTLSFQVCLLFFRKIFFFLVVTIFISEPSAGNSSSRADRVERALLHVLNVIICECTCLCRSFSESLGRAVDVLVHRSVAWSRGRPIRRSMISSVAASIASSFGWSIDRSVNRFIVVSVACLVTRSLGQFLGRFVVRSARRCPAGFGACARGAGHPLCDALPRSKACSNASAGDVWQIL